jgi:RHS repeat-associated protein
LSGSFAHWIYNVNRVSRDANSAYEYYHNDGIGSTRQLSNDTQSVTQTTTFDAFGNVESSTGSSNNVYRYAGQWGYRNDGDDGLMHVGARYYDPLVGRFISADTWLGEIARPQSLNRYVYCEGDPVNTVDPSGHKGISSILSWVKANPGVAAVGGFFGGLGTIGGVITQLNTWIGGPQWVSNVGNILGGIGLTAVGVTMVIAGAGMNMTGIGALLGGLGLTFGGIAFATIGVTVTVENVAQLISPPPPKK